MHMNCMIIIYVIAGSVCVYWAGNGGDRSHRLRGLLLMDQTEYLWKTTGGRIVVYVFTSHDVDRGQAACSVYIMNSTAPHHQFIQSYFIHDSPLYCIRT